LSSLILVPWTPDSLSLSQDFLFFIHAEAEDHRMDRWGAPIPVLRLSRIIGYTRI